MKRPAFIRAAAMLLALILALGCITVPALAAENNGVTLKLHYDRPDGAYDDWSVWFWIEGSESATVTLPEGKWDVYVADTTAGTEIIGPEEGEVSVAPISAMVLVQSNDAPRQAVSAVPAVSAAALISIAAALFVILRRKKK